MSKKESNPQPPGTRPAPPPAPTGILTDNTAVIRALEQRVEELEKGIMKQHEENARLQDTIIYAKGRMKAYGIVDARIDLPGGWNEK